MKKLLSIVLIYVFMAVASPAACMASTPTETIKSTIDKVLSVLNNPGMKGAKKEPERRASIRQAVFNVFDFREMAMRSLAKNWKPLSAKDKDEFSSLYADLLERSYINRIESYSGEKIMYDGESVDGDYAVVKTRFLTARREEILVDYKLMKKDGNWWVYDVVIERVSLVNNYRIQFNKIIRSSSYAELVRKMKDKAESELLVGTGS